MILPQRKPMQCHPPEEGPAREVGLPEFTTLQRVEVPVPGAGSYPIAYREAGRGEPLLLVHGWPLSSRTWRKVVPELASDRRCIAPDLLGAGETSAPPGADLGLRAQGQVLGSFLDALGLDRVALVGHDSGGSVARAFAIAQPERVSRLVLADTEVPGHRPPLTTVAPRLASLPGVRALLAAVLGSRRISRLVFRPFFAEPRRFDFDEFFEAVVVPNARSVAAAEASLRFLRDFDFGDVDAARAGYDRLTMPKLLIWGEGDRVFPIAEGRRLAEQLPGPTRFETVTEAGLFVPEEAPGAWTTRVGPFLQAAS